MKPFSGKEIVLRPLTRPLPAISLIMVRTTVALVFVGLALLVTGINRLRKK